MSHLRFCRATLALDSESLTRVVFDAWCDIGLDGWFFFRRTNWEIEFTTLILQHLTWRRLARYVCPNVSFDAEPNKLIADSKLCPHAAIWQTRSNITSSMVLPHLQSRNSDLFLGCLWDETARPVGPKHERPWRGLGSWGGSD